MSNPSGECAAAEKILAAAEAHRGGLLNYTAYHAFRLLEALSRGPLGRPRIVRLLGLGEASVKTLLSRMRQLGLVDRDPAGRGYILTRAGREALGSLSELIRIYKPRLGVFEDTTAIVVAGVPAPRTLVDVYRVRDVLVMEGCREALIGGVEAGQPHYPGVPEELARFLEAWDPGVDKGLVIIAPGHCIPAAYTAALRIALGECRRGTPGPGVTGGDRS